MFDRFTDAVGGAFRWAAGRGATTLATGLAAMLTAQMTGWTLPIFGLALSMPMTVYRSTRERHHIQKQIVDLYRPEIAAALGIPPHAVTMDEVRLAASGNDATMMPANRTIGEALSRNDHHRTIAIVANVLSAVVTIGAILGASSLGLGILDSKFLTFLGSVALSYGIDVSVKHLGNELFNNDGPSLHERILGIAQNLRHGRGLTQETLMNLIVDANPKIEREIEQRYGVAYEALPSHIKSNVVARFEPAFEIAATTYAINHGLLPVGELAFTIEGFRSGVSWPVDRLVSSYKATLPPQKVEPSFYYNVPGYEQAHKFVDRIRKGRPGRPAGLEAGETSHVDRLEDGAEGLSRA